MNMQTLRNKADDIWYEFRDLSTSIQVMAWVILALLVAVIGKWISGTWF